MIGVGSAPTETASIAVRPGSLTLSLGSKASVAFDLEGRLYSAYLDGRTFRRGLSGRVFEKGRVPGSGRGERWCRECAEEERLALYRAAHALAEEVRAAHLKETARLIDGDRERATVLLSRVLRWTLSRLEGERHRFLQAYRPVGILPPDQYLAVVLQATEGCAWNRCTFCPFYRGQPFRIKTPGEFLAHLQAVRELLGDGIRLRRSIFLGEANALGVPVSRLLTFMDMAREEFSDHREIHAFMDVFSTSSEVDEFRALRARGLRRVVIGLETGCDELRGFVRKPGSAAETVRVVRCLKAAGISVGLVVLLGIGNVRYFDDHVKETIRVINAMGLGRGDIVYFSPLVEVPGVEYFEQAQAHGIGRLRADEVRVQEAIIRQGLNFSGDPPKLARYDVREFLY